MSRVFVATDLALSREVALKVLPADHVSDDAVERFRREILLGARLRHPHILPVYAAGRAGGHLFYTMPLVAGESLRARLDRQPALPVPMATRILREVASALAYAHREGVVHRDVKPENIFLEETGVDRALLADFGVARLLRQQTGLTLTGTAIGTPLYMSPEQVDGRDVDARSDIYSLGMVGWEILAGRRPWSGETLYTIIYNQKYEHLPSLGRVRADVPRRVQRAIERAVAKDRDLRWSTADAFAAALVEPARTPHSPRADRASRVLTPAASDAAEVPGGPAEAVFAVSPDAVTSTGSAVAKRRWRGRRAAQVSALVLALAGGGAVLRHVRSMADHPGAVDRAAPAPERTGDSIVRPARPEPIGTGSRTARSAGIDTAAGSLGTAAGPVSGRATRRPSPPGPQLSPGAVALLGASSEPIDSTIGATSRQHDDSLSRCGSPTPNDQQVCLYALVGGSEASLRRAYDTLVEALRRDAPVRFGGLDPPALRRLREEQAAWVTARDLRCWHSGGIVPPLWAPVRARCLDDATARRVDQLTAELRALPRSD